MSTQHTPTPWAFSRENGRVELYYEDNDVRPRIAIIDDNTDDLQQSADAALIVRAVNNHDALIAALENALNQIKAIDEDYDLFGSWQDGQNLLDKIKES